MIGENLNRAAIISQNSSIVPVSVGAQVAQAMTANNQGVFINSNKVIELFVLPDTFVVTYANSNEVGDVAKTCYFFNEDVFEACPVTNTAGTPVRTYSDGYTGKNYNALLRSYNGGRGVKFSGFNVDFTNASGNADSSAFGTANMAILGYDGTGETVPVNINLSKAARNTAQNVGLLTVLQEMYLNASNQVKITVPKGDTLVLTFMVSPDQK